LGEAGRIRTTGAVELSFAYTHVSNCCSFYRSSIGKKWVVAVTGVLLLGFVIFHLIGNLQFFWGPKLINEYGTHLRELPFGILWVLRVGLLATVVLHIVTTIKLVIENRKAKGTPYAYKASVQAKLATRLMALSGILLLSYIVFHLMHFTTHNVNADYATWKDGKHHDVYRMLVAGFSNVMISGFYILAMVLLAMHLSHGVSSMFQTMGLRTKKMAATLAVGAQVLAWGLCLGYISIPAAVMGGFYDKEYIASKSQPGAIARTKAEVEAAEAAARFDLALSTEPIAIFTVNDGITETTTITQGDQKTTTVRKLDTALAPGKEAK
jgi:succinate dehydrogenase / fumarate reductase, cytochrome b subunit